jgi:hypothetical protein
MNHWRPYKPRKIHGTDPHKSQLLGLLTWRLPSGITKRIIVNYIEEPIKMKMWAILKKDFLNELTLMNVRRESKEEVLEKRKWAFH